MDHPVDFSLLPASVQAVVGPAAPGPMKFMAARGLAALSPADMVTALYALSFDANAALAAAAAGTLQKLPAAVLGGALDAALLPHVLDHVAKAFEQRETVLERVVLNPATSDETFGLIAKVATERVSEIVAANEARLLRSPWIIETLYLNRNTRMSTAARVIELAVRNGLVLQGIAAYKEIAAGIGQELIPEASDEALPGDEEFRQAQALGTDDVDIVDPDSGADDSPEEERVKAKFQPLQYKLTQMSISEKIRLATIGTAAHRALLIRDPNRLVHMSVIRSPGINEREVENYANNRGTPEDVIRFIATKREWLRPYSIKLALALNPKTPPATALHLLPHVRLGELKSMSRSKNISVVVAQAARDLVRKKTGGEK